MSAVLTLMVDVDGDDDGDEGFPSDGIYGDWRVASFNVGNEDIGNDDDDDEASPSDGIYGEWGTRELNLLGRR